MLNSRHFWKTVFECSLQCMAVDCSGIVVLKGNLFVELFLFLYVFVYKTAFVLAISAVLYNELNAKHKNVYAVYASLLNPFLSVSVHMIVYYYIKLRAIFTLCWLSTAVVHISVHMTVCEWYWCRLCLVDIVVMQWQSQTHAHLDFYTLHLQSIFFISFV